MILLIDNYDSFTYNLFQSLSLCATEVKIIRNDQISLQQIEQLNPEAIVLSPGPGRPEHAGIILSIIENFKDKTPILGICLGHQAIGQVFGAKIISCPEILHGKSSKILHNNSGLFQKFEGLVGRYHSLCIDKATVPKELKIEALSESGIIMGISHKKYPIYGLQFHPESFLTPHGNRLLETFINNI